MLDQLQALMSTEEFDERGSLGIESVGFSDQHVAITLELRLEKTTRQVWRIDCSGALQHQIGDGYVEDLDVTAEHVLLWPHTEPHVELFYRGRPADRVALLGELAEAHWRMVGPWFSLDRFLNPHPGIVRLFEPNHGMFAEGPDRIIQEYASVLRRHGIQVSSPPPWHPKRWDGQAWVEGAFGLKLLLLGRSWVVCSEVTARRIQP